MKQSFVLWAVLKTLDVTEAIGYTVMRSFRCFGQAGQSLGTANQRKILQGMPDMAVNALKDDALTTNSKAGGSKRHRLQFEFSPDAFRQLQETKEKTGAASYAETVRDALRLYEWYLTQKEAGYEIGLLEDGELKKRVELLF